MNDPARLVARIRRKAVKAGWTVEADDTGFTLSAEVDGLPRARGRRYRERLTHRVELDRAAGTYRITDSRETLDEIAGGGTSLLRLDRRAEAAVDPGVEAHRLVDEAAEALGWTRGRTGPKPGQVVAVIAGVCVVVLIVALFLIL
ncbi:hypothetical protein GCM10009836_63680 [Pseudonocardia ailaonensis]|uniref:Uncharacterized protein n=1 Tax=Pseudonocardia ailaonensis TaxID=367279 RepID=A0ABN2NL00_9PSEU